MVQTVVSFRCKVREERGKPIPHREPVGVAESPMAEIDGRGISAIRTRIDVMLLERGGQSAHAGGTDSYQGRRCAGGRGWQGNTRPKLKLQECRHPIGRWQLAGRIDLAPVAAGFCRVEEVICRFVYRQAEDALRVGGDVGERNGATTGVAVQMEAVPAGILGGLADAVELHRDVVPLRRGARFPLELEVLGNKPGAVFQLSEEAGGGEVVGDCTAGALDLR